MPDHVRAQIPFVYPMTFMPLRGTKPRDIVVLDTVETELRGVSSSEAPKAFEAVGTYKRYQGRLLDGKVYMPAVQQGLLKEVAGPRKFEGFPQEPAEASNLLYPGYNRQELKMLAFRKTVERPTGLTRVIHDGYEEARQATLDALAGFVLVDGGLHRRSAPAVYAFEARSEDEWGIEIVDGTKWLPSQYSFALDRREEAEAFRERAKERGLKRIDEMSRLHVEVFDRKASAFDECAGNAAYAVSQVLGSFGNWLHTHSPDMIRIAYELSLARGDFLGPAQDPAGVHRILGELQEATPEKDRSALRRHVANAIDAIESARDFAPAPIALTP